MAKISIPNITINKVIPSVDLLEIRISFAQLLAFMDIKATTSISLMDGHYQGIANLVTIYNTLTPTEQAATKKFLKMCVVDCFNNAMGTTFTWDQVPDTLFQ